MAADPPSSPLTPPHPAPRPSSPSSGSSQGSPASSGAAASGVRGEEDRALAARLRRGDQAALAALYDRYAGVTLALLTRIVQSRAEAEDLLQEVFLHAWRRAPDYDPQRGSFSCWLLTIARNRALDLVRSPRHRRPQQADREQRADDLVPGSESPEEAASLVQRAQAVRSALGELTPAQREAIELAYYGGLSHSEIALRTGEPLGTIKSRINQAASRLRAALGRLGGSP